MNYLNEINLNKQNENAYLHWSYPLIEQNHQRGDNNSFSTINLNPQIHFVCIFQNMSNSFNIADAIVNSGSNIADRDFPNRLTQPTTDSCDHKINA